MFEGVNYAFPDEPNCPTCLKGNFTATTRNIPISASFSELYKEDCLNPQYCGFSKEIMDILTQGEKIHLMDGKPQLAKIYVIDELKKLDLIPPDLDEETQQLETQVRQLVEV